MTDLRPPEMSPRDQAQLLRLRLRRVARRLLVGVEPGSRAATTVTAVVGGAVCTVLIAVVLVLVVLLGHHR